MHSKIKQETVFVTSDGCRHVNVQIAERAQAHIDLVALLEKNGHRNMGAEDVVDVLSENIQEFFPLLEQLKPRG